MLRLGCIERKVKGKTGGVGGLERATAHFRSFVTTGFSSQAHDPAWVHVIDMSAQLGCARDRDFWPRVSTKILCCDRVWG